MATHTLPLPCAPALDAALPPKPRRRLLRRLMAALLTARQRQADAEIARYLAATGWKLTDAVEREIERRCCL